MTDLKISKAIAGIKGIKYDTSRPGSIGTLECSGHPAYPPCFVHYNPVTDKALNLELRDEFEVEIDYNAKQVLCTRNDYLVAIDYHSCINRAVCLAIIECIATKGESLQCIN